MMNNNREQNNMENIKDIQEEKIKQEHEEAQEVKKEKHEKNEPQKENAPTHLQDFKRSYPESTQSPKDLPKGLILKRAREQQGLTLEAVHEGTKVPMATSTLLRAHKDCNSSGETSLCSSLVPEGVTSIAGNTRLSARPLSSLSSIFPVPLNSSNITSSILDPVSTRAVPRIVKLPPPSIFLAAPKNCFTGVIAVESKPPESIRPLAGDAKLWALAKRVIESSSMTTSLPSSVSLFALSIASLET